MFSSAYDVGFIGRFARALTALVFLTANIAPVYAQGLAESHGATSYAGPAAVLGVRIPFGGRGTTSSQPMIGLSLGSSSGSTATEFLKSIGFHAKPDQTTGLRPA